MKNNRRDDESQLIKKEGSSSKMLGPTSPYVAGRKNPRKVPVEDLIKAIEDSRKNCKHDKELTIWREDFIVCGGCGQRVG